MVVSTQGRAWESVQSAAPQLLPGKGREAEHGSWDTGRVCHSEPRLCRMTWSPLWVEVAEFSVCAPTACCPTLKYILECRRRGGLYSLLKWRTPNFQSLHRPAPGMAEQRKECFLETQTWVQMVSWCPSGARPGRCRAP